LAITAVRCRRSYAHLVVQLFDDPFDDRRDRARRISQVTRRDIFDYLRAEGGPWWGRLSEVAFLARLYDLEALPSTDGRFKTADGDIRQHRVANYDWDDDWVFDDPRFRLASGPDEVLLGFLAQMVHPVVQPDTGRVAEVVSALNELLAPDGWMLKRAKLGAIVRRHRATISLCKPPNYPSDLRLSGPKPHGATAGFSFA
jgi:hypothetical protein